MKTRVKKVVAEIGRKIGETEKLIKKTGHKGINLQDCPFKLSKTNTWNTISLCFRLKMGNNKSKVTKLTQGCFLRNKKNLRVIVTVKGATGEFLGGGYVQLFRAMVQLTCEMKEGRAHLAPPSSCAPGNNNSKLHSILVKAITFFH